MEYITITFELYYYYIWSNCYYYYYIWTCSILHGVFKYVP